MVSVLSSTVLPPAPKGYLLGCFTKIYYQALPDFLLMARNSNLQLITKMQQRITQNFHMKQSHYFIAQIKMMGLNKALTCTVTAQRRVRIRFISYSGVR